MAGMTLAQALERLRRDLGDLDATAERWSDEDLERHLRHALQELSEQIPRQLKNTLSTVANSRDISIATLTGRLRVVAVEWKTGEYPPVYQRFSIWQDTLTLLVENEPSAVENVAVYWEAVHTLDPEGTTIPEWAEEILLLGGRGYAELEYSSQSVNRVNVGGPNVADLYHRAANGHLQQFRHELRRRGKSGSLRTSSLYVPAAPLPTQDSDPGPP